MLSGASGGTSEPAAKVRKLNDLAAICSSSAKLNSLPLHKVDSKVKLYGNEFVIFDGSRRSYVYGRGVLEACAAALKKDGVSVANKIIRLDAMLSPAHSRSERTKAADFIVSEYEKTKLKSVVHGAEPRHLLLQPRPHGGIAHLDDVQARSFLEAEVSLLADTV